MTDKNTENVSEMDIYGSLKEVIDPELYVNIVDLGLVYGVYLKKETRSIKIELTLTSKGCPMGDMIIQNVEKTLIRLYPDFNVMIVLVWEPSWSMEMVSDEGRAALNGF